ncbi:MAG TPA: DNA polymerase III subunit delta [Gemmatimonadales bacterium]|nr:DNA polymerase III subunit delta [Gemmatimonadales bacterium]
MPTLSVAALRKELKAGKLRPVYYFHGPEETLKEEAAQALLDAALDPSLRDFNFDQRSAQSLDAESLHALVNTLPMMAERRVVILRDVEALKKKGNARTALLKYLDDPADGTMLILLQSAARKDERDDKADADLAAKAPSTVFDELDTDEAMAWVERTAKKLGVQLAPDAVKHLVAAVGPELALLRLELQKFSALESPGPIDAKLVGALVGVQFGETIYDWRDAILEGDLPRALRLSAPLLDQTGVSAVGMVTLLGSSLIVLGVARAHHDRKLAGFALNKAVFDTLMRARPPKIGDWKGFVNDVVRWAPAWPQGRLRRALEATLAADIALKGTRLATEQAVITDLILQLAPPSTGGRREVA